MDAVSDTCHGVGYYLLQSGLHHFYGLSGYTGRMDLCVHVYIYAHIRWRYLSEPFLVIPEIFVEKALYDLSVGAVCGNGHCAADTDGHRIPCLLPLAAASCAGIVFLGSHADGLHFFFYAVTTFKLNMRCTDDTAPDKLSEKTFIFIYFTWYLSICFL